jgi:murein DD-endopeptidase MepM/ murein hydrolase activator NlpD
MVNARALSFSSAGGGVQGFYALVATRSSGAGSFGLAAAGQPSGDPFLLGPDNQSHVRGEVIAPEAFRVDLLNPLTGEVLRDAVLCKDLTLPRKDTLGCVTTEFGDGKPEGYDLPTRHRGIDLRTDLAGSIGVNHPVFPAADGVVHTAGYSSSMGCYVVVDHAGGYSTVYAHFELSNPALREGPGNCDLSVNPGDEVEACDTQLGVSGNTGLSFHAHLHFELLPTGNMNFKTDPRGLGIFARQYRSELSTSVYISYPDPKGGNERLRHPLPTEHHYLEIGGSGVPSRRHRVTVSETITRAAVLALVGERPEYGLVYIADAFTWTGRAPGKGSDEEQFHWSKQVFDWAVPVGVVGVEQSPVPLAERTTVFGYGFNPDLSGGNADIDVYFHSAGRDGPSAAPNLPGVVDSRSALDLAVVVPGPSHKVSDNAAWGTVLVEFRNKRNSTREGTSGDGGSVRILPVVDAITVTDGVSPDRARGGKTVLVEGSGFFSGPSGVHSLTAGVQTTGGGQGLIDLTPTALDPLSWKFITPDHLFSGPATVVTRVEELEGASGDGQLTVYPYILSAPKIGASGDGATVTGTGLGPEVTVRFNGGSYAAAGNGTSAAVTIGDGIRSGAITLLAGGQASGNGVRFVALPTVTITAVDATTGATLGVGIYYGPIALDDPNQGVYDEGTNLGLAPQQSHNLLGSGLWGYRLNADGYEEASGSFGLMTTTPVEVTVLLTLRAPIGTP